jgi:hypothetical protein
MASKACGGYHLAIDNLGGSEIMVRINGSRVTSIEPGETADIAQWGTYSVPLMPWDVELRRLSDGVVVLSLHVVDDGTDGRRVRVGDTPVESAPTSAYVCDETGT